jgi:hypothetical protein
MVGEEERIDGRLDKKKTSAFNGIEKNSLRIAGLAFI